MQHHCDQTRPIRSSRGRRILDGRVRARPTDPGRRSIDPVLQRLARTTAQRLRLIYDDGTPTQWWAVININDAPLEELLCSVRLLLGLLGLPLLLQRLLSRLLLHALLRVLVLARHALASL